MISGPVFLVTVCLPLCRKRSSDKLGSPCHQNAGSWKEMRIKSRLCQTIQLLESHGKHFCFNQSKV